jgi:hypothetical protein
VARVSAGLSRRRLCGSPTCDEVGEPCTSIDSLPDVGTAWEVTAATASKCDFLVTEETSVQFLPPDYDSNTGYYESLFANTVTSSNTFFNEVHSQLVVTLVMGLAMPFAIALLWFLMLFLFAGFIIWASLFLCLAFLVASTIFLYYKAGLFDSTDLSLEVNATTAGAVTSAATSSAQTAYITGAVIETIFLVIYVILLVMWRKKIARAVAIVRETTKVFYSIPFLTGYPLISVLWNLGLLAYAIVIAAFIMTQGQISWDQMETALNGSTAKSSSTLDSFLTASGETQKYAMLGAHVFGCIWGFLFISAAVYMTYAGTAARWFFSHENGVLNVKFFGGVCTIFDSAWCVFTRHLGSIAFSHLLSPSLAFPSGASSRATSARSPSDRSS